MGYQKFIPEGWQALKNKFSLEELYLASENGDIMQGKVERYDSNYNLYINLGNNITGIIPRDEIEAINIDETGFPKPNICASKVDRIVQFKVKDIKSNDMVILSRKAVGKEAVSWMKNDLKEGMTVFRNRKKYKTLWSFCGNWRRNCRASSYRRYICCENKITI